MFNKIIDKLNNDKEYWQHEFNVYKKILDQDDRNEEAQILKDGCQLLIIHCENLIQELNEMMKEKYTMLYLKCKKFADDKGDFTLSFSTSYRVLVQGEENKGKQLKWFSVYFRGLPPKKAGYLQAKREDLIIPKVWVVETLPNGKIRYPYITVLNYEEFYEDEEDEN